jgi:hypothetical protein
MTATDKHATIELFKAMLSVGSVPMLYSEGQLPLEKSSETAVRRGGGRCEMVASLRVTWSNELVVGQSPAAKNVSMEAEDIVGSR